MHHQAQKSVILSVTHLQTLAGASEASKEKIEEAPGAIAGLAQSWPAVNVHLLGDGQLQGGVPAYSTRASLKIALLGKQIKRHWDQRQYAQEGCRSEQWGRLSAMAA
jgi:hypothetical protein